MRSKLFLGLLLAAATAFGQAGRLDETYDVGTGTNDVVLAMALDQQGKAVIAGAFTTYNGVERNYVARLETDGSLDAAFNPGAGPDAAVAAVAVQPDGKILIGGNFTTYAGVARNRLARLNDDGSLDLGFEASATMNQTVRCLAVQPDGKIIVGGTFTNYNGTPANSIARLNADGSQDLSFDPGTGAIGAPAADPNVYAIAVQPDGKIILAGSFRFYNGVARNRITRLNSDGSLDMGFNPQDPDGTGGPNERVTCMALQPDGKIMIGGFFTTYNNAPRKYVARLNSDGSLNYAFNPAPGPNSYLECLAVQSDGSVVMGGAFISYAGQTTYLLARSLRNGEVDPTFNTSIGVTGTGPHVRCLAIQPDGNIVICGYFSSYQGVPGKNIARVLGGETLQLTLNVDANASETKWELLTVNDSVVASGGPYPDGVATLITEQLSVPAGCYKFMLHDAGGNGISAGGYILADGSGRRIIDANGEFGSLSTTGSKFCVPLGPVELVAADCDDLDHSASDTVKCSNYPGAIGYQFWAFDPHGSFAQRTNSTGRQVGANRLALLPTDLELNLRVRALLPDSTYTPFGPACTFMIAGPGMAPQQPKSMAMRNEGELMTWPNPVNGSQVQLTLGDLDATLQNVQVQLYDATGRPAISTVLPVAGGNVNGTLELGRMAQGVYLLQVIAGEEMRSMRLVVGE